MSTNESGLNNHDFGRKIDHGREYYIRGLASIGSSTQESTEPSIRKPAIPYDYKDPSRKVKGKIGTLEVSQVTTTDFNKTNPPPIPEDSK